MASRPSPPRPTAPVADARSTRLAGWLGRPARRPRGDLDGVGVTGVTLELAAGAARRPVRRAAGRAAPTARRTPPRPSRAGAVAVLTDAGGRGACADAGVPVLVVDRAARRCSADLAARVYGDPAARAADDRRHRHPGQDHHHPARRGGARRRPACRPAVIGTVGTRIAGADVKTALTTPEAPDLHALFAVMRERGVDGLRDGGLQPRAGDGPGRRRGLRRRRLHQPRPRPPRLPRRRRGLLRGQGRRCSPPSGPGSAWSTSTTSTAGGWLDEADGPGARPSRPPGADADWRAVDVDLGADGSTFTRRSARTAARRGRRARCPATSTSPTRCARSPPAARPGFDAARGRRRRSADGGRGARPAGAGRRRPGLRSSSSTTPTSPTPSSAALDALRPLTDGRLIVVLGAGGDRDPGKRPMMGEIAAPARRRARGHRRQPAHRGPGRDPGRDPGRAPDGGRGRGARGRRPPGGDRARPSRRAGAGDIVLVAGKGHETGQEVAGVVHPFDDRDGAARGAGRERPMIALTLAEIADVVGGTVVDDDRRRAVDRAGVRRQPGRRAAAGCSSRSPGERVDGHDYAARGGRRPARPPCSALAADRASRPSSSTTRSRALGAAGPARRSTRLPDADRASALTGSQGKTGTKDLLAQVLAGGRPDGRDRRHPSTTSSACRSPCCAPTPTTRYLVVEMGARGIGHIAELVRDRAARRRRWCSTSAPPTSASSARSEAIAQAKGEIVEALPADGRRGAQRRRPAGRRDGRPDAGPGAHLRHRRATPTCGSATSRSTTSAARRSTSGTTGDRAPTVALGLLGEHQVANAAAAAAMALAARRRPRRRRRRARPRATAPRRRGGWSCTSAPTA